MSSVSVAGVDLPVADEMKVLGVVLDRRLSFERHATSVARACNFHAQAIRHIRSLLTPDLTLTLACSLILSRLDYCNACKLDALVMSFNPSTKTASTRGGLRSAESTDYVQPRLRTKFAERGFSYAGLAAWNRLPAGRSAEHRPRQPSNDN